MALWLLIEASNPTQYVQPGVLQFNIHRRNQEMLLDSAENSGWRKPLRVWLTVLATLFCTEAAVVEIIPWIIPALAGHTRQE